MVYVIQQRILITGTNPKTLHTFRKEYWEDLAEYQDATTAHVDLIRLETKQKKQATGTFGPMLNVFRIVNE